MTRVFDQPAAELQTAAALDASHFACLRAIFEGVEPLQALQRYLNLADARHARSEYRHLVDRVQALAKRRGDPRWRLLALELQDPVRADPSAALSLEDWAAERGLDGWSQAELLSMYLEHFASTESSWNRRKARAARLRERRQALLRDLERTAASAASRNDHVIGWFPDRTAKHLATLGVSTLGQLDVLVSQGGRWWGRAKGFGPQKAARVATLLRSLLPHSGRRAWSVDRAMVALAAYSGAEGSNRRPDSKFRDDGEAVAAWLREPARSRETNSQYSREVERFRIWCALLRERALVDVEPVDFAAYAAFLAAVPEHWISRRRSAPMTPGWAPFRGQLTQGSQDLAMAILRSLFAWLAEVGHLRADPWAGVARARRELTPSKPAPLVVIPDEGLELGAVEPSTVRLVWLHEFTSKTGIGPAKVARSRRGDLRRSDDGWSLSVGGRGGREFAISVPSAVVELTRRYFASRGLDFDTSPADVPLLASLSSPRDPIGYRAALGMLTRYLARARA